IPVSVFKPEPPPLWYVTNGEITVGPVITDLLMRGVEFGRVPEHCCVRALRGGWRNLESVREIAALTSKPSIEKAPSHDQLSEWARPVERIRDEDEFCDQLTRLSLIVTGAESAMLHYRNRSAGTLITRSILGPMSNERLGHVLPEQDLVLKSARLGRPVLGPPYGPTEDALAIRFATSDGGVGGAAMVPIFIAGTLMAMLELSRPGHGFRRVDLRLAERIVQRAVRLRSN
ncbi:MAG TPA: GAF domain-containing protein, partial [Polyangiaceae bacterium]|nr:GAF domain-containing protein [Polyangiaceae bacterium]